MQYVYKICESVYTSWIKSLILPKVDLPQTRGKRFLQETLMEKGGGPVPAIDAIRLHRLSMMNVHFQDPPAIILANMF